MLRLTIHMLLPSEDMHRRSFVTIDHTTSNHPISLRHNTFMPEVLELGSVWIESTMSLMNSASIVRCCRKQPTLPLGSKRRPFVAQQNTRQPIATTSSFRSVSSKYSWRYFSTAAVDNEEEPLGTPFLLRHRAGIINISILA